MSIGKANKPLKAQIDRWYAISNPDRIAYLRKLGYKLDSAEHLAGEDLETVAKMITNKSFERLVRGLVLLQ